MCMPSSNRIMPRWPYSQLDTSFDVILDKHENVFCSDTVVHCFIRALPSNERVVRLAVLLTTIWNRRKIVLFVTKMYKNLERHGR